MAKKKPSAATDLLQPATGAMPRRSKYQRETRQVARRELNGADYNPRVIDKAAKARLQKLLRKRGLVSTVTWNERSGNIVGGHRRIEILDMLEGSLDYSLDVTVVNLSEKDEIELNVELNSHAAAGTYDLVKLEDLFQQEGIDLSGAFDSLDLQAMFPDSGKVKSMFSLDNQPDEVKDAVKDAEALAAQKRRKKDWKAAARADDDTEFHLLAIFKDRADRERFMAAAGLDPDARYIAGEALFSLIGDRDVKRAKRRKAS